MNDQESIQTIMKRILLFLFLLASMGRVGAEKVPGNPKPLPDDLVLPMPGSQQLVFRPVAVGPVKSSFQAKVFKIGDRAEGGFQEFPTDISVGGAVSMPVDGENQWVYFMGKYEITVGQWHAVMGTGSESELSSDYPMCAVSWFEVQQFINKLNQWLFANAIEQLPKNDSYPCFLRLPTEAEWEFCSRGGTKVSANQFDRKHPYDGPMTKYEWFSGPRSSNDKAKRVGRKLPNPLGIHDMLGNVAEMTSSQYSVEYFQGRVGGMVTRGGHFFTSEDKIRASARDEFPVYNPENDYQPRRSATLGLRLVLSSPIFINPHVHKQMEEEWETYRKVRTVPSLASPSAPNRAAQARGRIRGISEELEKLQAAINSNPNSPDVKIALGLVMGAAQNIQADANGVETLLINTLLDTAYIHGHAWGAAAVTAHYRMEMADNPVLASMREDNLKLAMVQQASAAISSERYAEAVRRLGGTDEDTAAQMIREKIEAENNRDETHKSQSQIELQILGAIKEHLEYFRKNQRFNEEAAKEDFFKIHYTE